MKNNISDWKTKYTELLRDDGTFQYFKTTCECGTHDLSIIFECEPDDFMSYLCLYGDLSSKYHNAQEFDGNTSLFAALDKSINKLLRFDLFLFRRIEHRTSVICSRLKDCWKILATGQLRMNEEFIFRNDDHIQEFIDALQYGFDRMKTMKKAEEQKADSAFDATR